MQRLGCVSMLTPRANTQKYNKSKGINTNWSNGHRHRHRHRQRQRQEKKQQQRHRKVKTNDCNFSSNVQSLFICHLDLDVGGGGVYYS